MITVVCDINFAADPKRKDELLAALDKAIQTFIEKGPGVLRSLATIKQSLL